MDMRLLLLIAGENDKLTNIAQDGPPRYRGANSRGRTISFCFGQKRIHRKERPILRSDDGKHPFVFGVTRRTILSIWRLRWVCICGSRCCGSRV